MENFFYEDKFHRDLDPIIYDVAKGAKGVKDLPDDWSVKCMNTNLEPMFQFKMGNLVDHIVNYTDTFEDQFPEDSSDIFKSIESAIKQSIDLEKLNSLIPKLYYPTGSEFTITKQDLLDYIK